MSTDQITIAGHSFTVPNRYNAGHVLTDNEASALNQTFHENLRNNFAKKVKDGLESSLEVDTLQQQLNHYAETYAFGVRAGGGGGPRDPVKSEAMEIARQTIRDAMRAKGLKLSEYTSAKIGEAAEKYLNSDRGQKVWEIAKARVAERRDAAGDELGDLVADLGAPETAHATANPIG